MNVTNLLLIIDPKDWDQFFNNKTAAVVVTETKAISTANIDILNPTKVTTTVKEGIKNETKPIVKEVRNGMYTITNGAKRISDCPMANSTLDALLSSSFSVFTLDETLALLGGVERDFNCASMCKRSPLFVFSDVSQGPPQMSCRRSVTKKVGRMSQVLFWGSLIFALISIVGFIVSLLITLDENNALQEPLLHKR